MSLLIISSRAVTRIFFYRGEGNFDPKAKGPKFEARRAESGVDGFFVLYYYYCYYCYYKRQI